VQSFHVLGHWNHNQMRGNTIKLALHLFYVLKYENTKTTYNKKFSEELTAYFSFTVVLVSDTRYKENSSIYTL
jgi:hypothetical protein